MRHNASRIGKTITALKEYGYNNGQSAAKLLIQNGEIMKEESSTTISKESTPITLGETVTTFYFYVLIDPRDGKIKYVGRTVDPKSRLRGHIYESKKNNRNKRERWIVSLLRKNLKPSLQIIYTLYCSLSEAIETEKMLVKKLTYRGYPLKNEPDNYLGAVLTGTPVHQYDLDGNYIRSYTSARQAEISTGIKDANISLMCKGKRNRSGMYLWSFNKCDKLKPYDFNWKSKTGKPIIYTDKFGNTQEFATARIAAKQLNISYKKISAVCNGRQKTTRGYNFRFKG